jgi:hypothetical protein
MKSWTHYVPKSYIHHDALFLPGLGPLRSIALASGRFIIQRDSFGYTPYSAGVVLRLSQIPLGIQSKVWCSGFCMLMHFSFVGGRSTGLADLKSMDSILHMVLVGFMACILQL